MTNVNELNPAEVRQPDHEILDLFWKRWSPRALSEPISSDELNRLLEAGRWAPSSYNEQPWRLIYGLAGTKAFDDLFGCLVEANQAWAKNTGALLLIAAKKTFSKNGKLNSVAVFDCGSFWQSMALQATSMGLYTHGMAGFNGEKARETFSIGDDYQPIAMIAVGRGAAIETLPEDYQKMEKITPRKAISEIAGEGEFPG